MERGRIGLLTRLQLVVLKYRLRGYSLREIARITGTSHQNIRVAEKRAIENIEAARKTLIAYHILSSPVKIVFREGTHLVDIPATIIRECDREGVRLRADFTYIYKLIRYNTRSCVRGTHVVEPILVLVSSNGGVHVYPYGEVESILEYLERI